MVEPISDDKFKSEVLKFIEVANQKFDGLTSDIRDNLFQIDKVDQKIDVIDRKLSVISSKMDQVTEKVVDHEKRIRSIEGDASTIPRVN